MIILNLFWEFFKVGLFTFGGGYAMIPVIEKEIVDKQHWLTLEQFADLFAVAEMTPGPIAINCATFVGYKVAKLWGAVASTLGVVTPSFLIMWVIASVFFSFQENQIVQAAFKGLRPAVLGLIIVAVLSISKVSIADFRSVLVAAFVVVAVWIFKIHPILAFLVSGVIGVVFFK
ncbi:MAG: chromate transporter [Candidatus Omnitrophica bacterium]|nr:chromate transporter [Candidatus Omnitrophota bacterium]MDD5552450.1 chromate transporter [Candidatus Omnitrophota bacterium]